MATLARATWVLGSGVCWTPTPLHLSSSLKEWKWKNKENQEKEQSPLLDLTEYSPEKQILTRFRNVGISLVGSQSGKAEPIPAGGSGEGEMLLCQQDHATFVRAL